MRWSMLPEAAFLLLAWVLLALPAPVFAQPGHVDQAWALVIAHAAMNGFQWGTEIVFTYGPLGYLLGIVYTPETWPRVLVFSGLHAAIYLLLLQRAAAATGAWRWLILIGGVFLPLPMFDVQMLLLALFTWLALERAADSRWDLAGGLAGLALLAVVAHVKFTFLPVGAIIVGGAAFAAAVQGRWRLAVGLPLLYSAILLLSWLWLAGQNLGNFPAHLRESLALSSGYSASMGQDPDAFTQAAGLAAAALCLAALLLPLRRVRVNAWRPGLVALARAGAFAVVTFFMWKQAFTRADDFHYITFAMFTPPFLALCLGTEFPRASGKTVWVIAAALLLVALVTGLPYQHMVGLKISQLSSAPRALFGGAALRQEYADLRTRHALPRIREEVGRATVDTQGYGESLAIYNGLNYRPAPVFHAYAAFTPHLQALNTHYYRDHGPEYVLWKIVAIDHRLPMTEQAGVLRELLLRYEPVLEEGGLLLLRRLPTTGLALPSRDPGPPITGTARPGQPIQVPPGLVWCELDLRPTLLGKLRTLLLRGATLHVDLVFRSPDQVPRRRRLIPALVRGGFVLSPAVFIDSHLPAAFAQDPAAEVAVLRVPVEGFDTRYWEPEFSYRLVPLHRPWPAPEPPPAP